VALFYVPTVAQGERRLDDEEARHAVKALRLKVGSAIKVTDGLGNLFDCRLNEASSSRPSFEVISGQFVAKARPTVHLAVSPTKNIDRIEWLVEKATELGVDEVTMLHCERSERDRINLDRLVKLAISAMKQSQQPWLPKLNNVTRFTDVLTTEASQKFIACVDETNPLSLARAIEKGKSSIILIGPEGDFSKAELALALQHQFVQVSLGNTRLRTETAGLAACVLLASA
jgi:16S rRNA (uracil1498-N3)-methyltransferase